MTTKPVRLVLVGLCAAATVAGCSSGSSGSSPAVSPTESPAGSATPTTAASVPAAAASNCLKEHGVDFPLPGIPNGGAPEGQPTPTGTFNAQVALAALKACGISVPQSGGTGGGGTTTTTGGTTPGP